MPRDTWRIAVDVTDIADLNTSDTLAEHGITEFHPTRRQWPETQSIGEAYYHDGCRGILAPSAAHLGGRVLVIFRPVRNLPGLTAMAPANRYDDLPPLPTGLRT